MHKNNDDQIKELMNSVFTNMAMLRTLSKDYWRVVIIALMDEERKDREASVMSQQSKESKLMTTIIGQVHDAMFDLMMQDKPVDRDSICNWPLINSEVKKLLENMPVDQFSAIFDKMYTAVKKELEEG